VVKARRLACIAAGVGTRHKSTKLLIKDEARAFKAVCDSEPLTGIPAGVCPNGNRLWYLADRFGLGRVKTQARVASVENLEEMAHLFASLALRISD
jgi:hypothetical protein